ncbi:Uncharacterised protein [uncultured archaeon]|nr:Uncharacterised protein [uncultured archaeon]
MNETDKRVDELEKRLNRIENGLKDMGIIAICKKCGSVFEPNTEKHIKVMGCSEPELNGWYCDELCSDLFADDWFDRNSVHPDI